MYNLVELVILFTSDSHGHLYPTPSINKDFSSQLKWCPEPKQNVVGGVSYLAHVVESIRQKYPYVLLLDAGDAFSDTMIVGKTKGKLPLKVMNSLRYDAMTPGNHDIDYGIKQLQKLNEFARFPFLAANLLNENTLQPLLGTPYIIRKFHNTSVAIYGLTYHLTPETTAKSNIQGAKYTLDFNRIERDLLDIRNQGVDLIIVLSHLGSEVDELLAKKTKNIDVIIGGHSHDPNPLRIVNGVIIAQTTPYYTGLGQLKLLFHEGKVIKSKGKIIPILPQRIPPEPKIEKLLLKAHLSMENQLNEVIGYSHTSLIRNYKSESPIDTFIGNVLRQMTKSEISILPGRGYGVTVPPGYITKEEITSFIPHGSKVYKVQLKGADIFQALEQSVLNLTNPDATERVGGLIQVTGLNFVYTLTTDIESKINHVYVNGSKLNPDQYYTVAMNQLIFEGGHHYQSLKNSRLIKIYPLNDQQMVTRFIRRYSPIVVQKEGWSIPLVKADQLATSKSCFPYLE